MDNKTAAPATGATMQDTKPDNSKIHIACPVEHRLLSQLLRGQTTRKILDGIIGTTNTPEYVSRLRGRGLSIAMEWIPAINRDGKKIRHGAYYLLPDDLDRVRKSLGVTNG